MRAMYLKPAFCPMILALAGNAIGAPADSAREAAELERLVARDEAVVRHAVADLNGDGLRDLVFIVEPKQAGADSDGDDGPRTLKIAIRSADGKLAVVKESSRAVYCRSCGGVFGDPFDSLDASRQRFSIHHYGGSSWRWAVTTTFAYSRRDNSWQLVQVDESSFHASNPEKMESKTHRPPRSFGKIDIADFDPQNFLGVGPT
jgi:hypothetical protein